MPRWVLLRHDLPDAPSHLDWMIERNEGDLALLTFRIEIPPDWSGILRGCLASPAHAATFEARATLLPDHRRAYLTYEGAVSGDRGKVGRLAEGDVLSAAILEHSLRITLQWEDCLLEVEGLRETEGAWNLRAQYAASAEG